MTPAAGRLLVGVGLALALIGAVAAFVLLRGTHAPEPSADAEPARA